MAPTTKGNKVKAPGSAPKKIKATDISKKEKRAKSSKVTVMKANAVLTPALKETAPVKQAKAPPTVKPTSKVKGKGKGGKKEEANLQGKSAIGKPSSPAKPKPKPTPKAKAKAKSPNPSPEEQDEEDRDEEDAVASDAEGEDDAEEVHLHGFSSEGEDSSDEEDGVEDAPALDVGKLPTVAKDDETIKRKLEKAKRQPTQDRGVIYLGRVPHGFYEDEMKAYFTQFGNVTRLRLSRSRKTGRSKHYAFIEFDSSTVAQIVAETMDNYLLLGHILRCKLVPKEEVHPELWVGANRKWRVVPHNRVARVQQNKSRTDEEKEKAENRLITRQEQKKRKLEEAGIDYDFDAVAYKKKVAVTA